MVATLQRIARNAPTATLTAVFTDASGEPVDPTGTVSVTAVTADGTSFLASTTATKVGAGSGEVTVSVAGAKLTQLNQVTATWTDGNPGGTGAVITSDHEICGGFLFSVAEARAAMNGALANTATYPTATMIEKRQEVEEEVERICDVAFVPRYDRVTIDGTGTNELLIPHNRLRAIRSVRVYSNISTATYTAFTTTQLAAVALEEDVVIARTDFGVFEVGQGNVIVEVEHGYDAPPMLLKDAAMLRLRSLLNAASSGIPDRATSFTISGEGTYRLDTPGVFKTGIPAIDAVYARFSKRDRDEQGPVPVSRTLHYDGNRFSVFHAGRHGN